MIFVRYLLCFFVRIIVFSFSLCFVIFSFLAAFFALTISYVEATKLDPATFLADLDAHAALGGGCGVSARCVAHAAKRAGALESPPPPSPRQSKFLSALTARSDYVLPANFLLVLLLYLLCKLFLFFITCYASFFCRCGLWTRLT
ncbi:hypothetical protein T492DRAFT_527026 [Pavlovales sp. CCMP2436]|nr:hypothetical protein T492DRAFT_527026 [Pavlovales sp. CCMP2436]